MRTIYKFCTFADTDIIEIHFYKTLLVAIIKLTNPIAKITIATKALNTFITAILLVLETAHALCFVCGILFGHGEN